MMRRSALSFEDTVRSRLLRLTVLLLLPGLSLAGMVTWRSLAADRTAVEGDLRQINDILARTVDGRIGETESRLRVLAASDALAANDIPRFTLYARTAATLGDRIVLADGSGSRLVDTRAATTLAAASPPIPWSMQITGHPAIGWGANAAGGAAITVTVPVDISGRHMFNLTEFVPLTAIQALLPTLDLPAGWIATLYNDQLMVAARSAGAPLYLGRPASGAIVDALRRNDGVVTQGVTPDGAAILFDAARSPRYDFAVAITAPWDSISEPTRQSLLLLVGVGSVLVVLGLLGALVVSGSISRPIEALAAAARRLGEGEPIPAIPGGLIEADEVARAMSSASKTLIERRAALSDMNATLAARVEARTAELAEANRALEEQRSALEEQRSRLGLVLDHMPIGVLVSHPDGAAMYANHEARRLVGFDTNMDLLPPGTMPRLRRNGAPLPLHEAPAQLARLGIVTSRDILSMERGDGSVVDLEVSAGPVLDRDGRVALAVTTMQDISARLEAEEARRRSQRLEAVGQLTGGVAHEFNNLLMAIGGCLDLLAPHVRGDRAHSLLENAARATDRGATLTRQLLAFSRRQHLQAEPVDLNFLVRGLVELLGTTLGRGIEVAMDLAQDCWPAMADVTQLELVLLNLAINARDAMPAGGRLLIGTGNAVLGAPRRAEEPPPGEYAVLIVTDTGTGMAPEVLTRAFEPFFTTKQVGQGSGLGLPHVLGVAQQLGGGVIVDSTVGEGTCLKVFLPRAHEIPLPYTGSSLVPPQPRALEGVRLLLVDDDTEVREIARAMLEEMGALVIEATGGRDALLRLRTEPDIDLLLADYTMPHMTGLELSQHVAVAAPGLPVVLMTGYSATSLGDMGPTVAAILQKPFRAEALVTILTSALNAAGTGQPLAATPST
jgi:PAS domain S-box-containing protein